MAKTYCNVGYIETEELTPGFWGPKATERPYFGELTRNTSKFQVSSGSTNDNVNVSTEISIISDPFAEQHFSKIRYVEFMGAKWKVTQVEPKRPRLILTIGGLWNGEETGSTEQA